MGSVGNCHIKLAAEEEDADAVAKIFGQPGKVIVDHATDHLHRCLPVFFHPTQPLGEKSAAVARILIRHRNTRRFLLRLKTGWSQDREWHRPDSRKLSPQQQEANRMAAFRIVHEQGYTQRPAAKAVGVYRQEVVGWCRKYEKGGYDALRARKRGSSPGEQTALQGWQCGVIVTLIRDRTPDQLKLPFVLWTRAAVRDLIAERFGVTLALTTMGNYLRNWGFTSQKPIRRAFEQNGATVCKWMEVEYPRIAKEARKEGARIFWCDETKATSEIHNGRSHAPSGQTPVVRETARRIKINMISAMTNRGEVRFMTCRSMMTEAKYAPFLARLVEQEDCPVYVIADNLRVHHGKKVKAWVEANSTRIKLFYIPSYSPELNPDELLNRDLKKNVHGKRAPRTCQQLKKSVVSFMRMLQKTPSRVISYFNSPKLACCR